MSVSDELNKRTAGIIDNYIASEVVAPLRATIADLDEALATTNAQLTTAQEKVRKYEYIEVRDNAKKARQALVPLKDKPGPGRAGLYTGDDIAGMRTVTGLQTIGAGEPIEDTNFVDGVIIAGKRDYTNCRFGPRKGATYSQPCVGSGNITQGLYGSTFTDCLIDAEKRSWFNYGIFAGNSTLRRVEIRGAVDSIDYLYQTTLPSLTESIWIHDAAYWKWEAPEVRSGEFDRQTHTDGVQFQRGKNITMRGDFIDGPDLTSGIMLNQAISDLPVDRLENILIEGVWFGVGMNVGINISVGRNNPFASLVIRNPRFEKKTTSPAYYILRNTTTFKGQILNPVFEDGTPAPISRGA